MYRSGRPLFDFSRRRPFDELRQRPSDRCERIGIVRIGLLSFAVKMRPFAECSSPFGIRLTYQFLEKRVRLEDLVDNPAQYDCWLIEMLEQELARAHPAKHHLRQGASGIIEVRFQI